MEHVGGDNSGADVGFFAIGGTGAAHVAFHPCEAGAARATAEVGATAARREMFAADTADFLELRRVFPDVGEIFFEHVAASQRKLHAGINVAPRRYVSGGMAGAARIAFERVFVNRGWRGAKFFDASH